MANIQFNGGTQSDNEVNAVALQRVAEAQHRFALQRQAEETQRKTDKEVGANPDSQQAMDKLFSGEADEERKSGLNAAANARYRQMNRDRMAAYQKEVGNMRLKDGAFKPDQAKHIRLEDGAAGYVAAGGRDITPKVRIGSTFEEYKAVTDWGSAMQHHHRAVRNYERRQPEKKKNDGGLTAARQAYKGVSLVPNRPMFKMGGVVYAPMSFKDGVPQINLHRSSEQGWCASGTALTETLERGILNAGRANLGP
jgi:hypothetical protein